MTDGEGFRVIEPPYGDLPPYELVLQRAFTEPLGVDNGPPTGRIGETVFRGGSVAAVAAENGFCMVSPDDSVALQVLQVAVNHKAATLSRYRIAMEGVADHALLLTLTTTTLNLTRGNSVPGGTVDLPLAASTLRFGSRAAGPTGTDIAAVSFTAATQGRAVVDLRPHGIMLYGNKGFRKIGLAVWDGTANESFDAEFMCREWRIR